MKNVLVALATLASAAFGQATIDEKLPSYAQQSGVAGSLNSVGSDTLNNLMILWAESYKKMYPNTQIKIEGKGSSTAPPALIEGASQFGPMSRMMKDSEIEEFETAKGYKPTPIGVALDSLAVFLHKDNPITNLSMTEVDSIFSSTLNRGGAAATKWGNVGGTSKYANMPINLYGRNTASGTYGYFKSVALKKGDFKPSVQQQPGSAAVVSRVSSDLGGIGYSGIGYKTSGVKIIALDGAEATYANVLDGSYPLGRMLFVYIDKAPGKDLDPVVKEFLTFVLSKEGQEIVLKDGYLPLTAEVADAQRAQL